jgi:hypothetical protein
MVSSITELEACLGAPGLPAKLKAIDHVDSHAAHWIAAAPLMAIAVNGKSGAVSATLGGGDPGFARASGAHALTIARSALDNADGYASGDGIACLFFAPDITETLRVNGHITEASPARIAFSVDECFVHCGKALIRSAFWQPAEAKPVAALPAAARFCVLGSADANGNADASPKGDPEGFLIKTGERSFALPDRTGNRRADGHRNVIANDRVALVAFAPGSTAAFEIAGRARLTRDAELLARAMVEGKEPLLATVIEADRARAYESQALRRARIWDAGRMNAPDRPNPAATLTAHIKLSQQRSTADAARFAITPEGTEKALAEDYKKNLY